MSKVLKKKKYYWPNSEILRIQKEAQFEDQ